MRRKIGIITHWDIPNYGTFLQAYGLQHFLANMLPDDDVYQIAYMNKRHKKVYYSYEVHENYHYWIINPFFYRDVIRRLRDYSIIKKVRRFHDYYLNYTVHTRELSSHELQKEKFDIIVLGSDILWDFSMASFGNDKHMFGLGLNADKIISYAASFGTVKNGTKLPEYVETGIKGLDAIAVRDDNSVAIAKKISKKAVVQTIDPTWLWNFKEDSNVVDSPMKDKYIVVYGLEFPEDMIEEAVKYARDNEYKIVCLDGGREKCTWCDIFIEQGDITPFEWCGYIKDAEIVMTCAFHGLVFSLTFQKKIFFYATQFMLDKASSTINMLGLEDVLIDNKSINYAVSYSWNYERISKKIDELRDYSIEYIRNNIL